MRLAVLRLRGGASCLVRDGCLCVELLKRRVDEIEPLLDFGNCFITQRQQAEAGLEACILVCCLQLALLESCLFQLRSGSPSADIIDGEMVWSLARTFSSHARLLAFANAAASLSMLQVKQLPFVYHVLCGTSSLATRWPKQTSRH